MSIFDKFKKKIGSQSSKKSDPKSKSERSRFASVESSKSSEIKTTNKTESSGKSVKTGVYGLGEMNRVIMGPVVTEKASGLRASNQYVFEVKPSANKSQIKKAFAVYYGVVPIKINSVKLPGKVVHFGRTKGKTRIRRKVIVTLPKGKTIEI